MKSDMLLMRAPYVMLTLNLSKFKLVALCRTISQVIQVSQLCTKKT